MHEQLIKYKPMVNVYTILTGEDYVRLQISESVKSLETSHWFSGVASG